MELTFFDLTDLLSYTPRLSRLSCLNLAGTAANIKSEVLTKLTDLVYLNVTIKHLEFDEFEAILLNFCSSLELLKISSQSPDKSYLDGDRWEQLISQNMPSVAKFIFSYHDTLYDNFETNPYHSLINRFYLPFWIKQRWMLRLSVSYD